MAKTIDHKIKTIKITKCSDMMLWYNQHVGEVFDVSYEEDNAYWCRERDGTFNCLNWVYKSDCELVSSEYDAPVATSQGNKPYTPTTKSNLTVTSTTIIDITIAGSVFKLSKYDAEELYKQLGAALNKGLSPYMHSIKPNRVEPLVVKPLPSQYPVPYWSNGSGIRSSDIMLCNSNSSDNLAL